MTKLRNWWSNFGGDTMLVSAILGLVLGLYFLVAYLFIRAI
jgi:hypothetical protein